MKGFGFALLVLGVTIAIGSLLLPTSVDTSSADALYGAGMLASRTYNLGLLQRQIIVFITGCTLFMAGIVLAVAGSISEASSAWRIGGTVGETTPAPVSGEPIPDYPRPIDPPKGSMWYALGAPVGLLAFFVIAMLLMR